MTTMSQDGAAVARDYQALATMIEKRLAIHRKVGAATQLGFSQEEVDGMIDMLRSAARTTVSLTVVRAAERSEEHTSEL